MAKTKVRSEEPNATGLKRLLWETLNDVRKKRITPQAATAVALQSREIMRVVRTEFDIAKMLGERPSATLIDFKTKKRA